MVWIVSHFLPLCILQDIQFWKHQEKEHAALMLQFIPQLEDAYKHKLQAWERHLSQIEQSCRHWMEIAAGSLMASHHEWRANLNQLLNTSLQQSRQFEALLLTIRQESKAVRGHPNASALIEHMLQEAHYFINNLQAIFTNHPHIAWQHYASPCDGQQKAYIHKNVEAARAGNYSGLTHTGEGTWSSDTNDEFSVPIGQHTLPPLPYAYDALEPYIDETTMRLHHDKHHQSYVDGLNNAERQLEKARASSNFELVKHWQRELAFNGSGHYLHTIFWNIMSPEGGGEPSDDLAVQIKNDFGSFEAFKAHFTKAAEQVEGGGWAILVWSTRSRRLEILQAEKHQNLTQWDTIPLLALDVWEHAYYLKYQNKRAEYVKAWWNVVHWPHVNERFLKAKTLKWMPY